MRRFLMHIVAVLGCSVLLSARPLTNPPHITSFTFDRTLQQIAFDATSGNKSCSFSITSSSANTTWSVPQNGSFGGVNGSASWGITPGGSATGETHTFTITVTNVNGSDSRQKLLRVVAGRGSNIYEEVTVVPALPSLALLTLVVGAAVLGVLIRRRG